MDKMEMAWTMIGLYFIGAVVAGLPVWKKIFTGKITSFEDFVKSTQEDINTTDALLVVSASVVIRGIIWVYGLN